MSKNEILSNPSLFYNKYKNETSPHIKITEFKYLIDVIKTNLEDENLFIPEFNNEKTLLLQEFYFLNDLYYDDIIRFCCKFVDVIDIIIRKKPGQIFPDYFHRKRYFYYMEYCIAKFPNIILFPTFDNIGATDLIKTREVPVFFLGISTTSVYADEFTLTPSEFFFHDINHSRIIYQQDEAYRINKGMKKEDLITEMENTRKYYYDAITIIQDKNLKDLMKMIIFEIVHEDGFPFVSDKICERLIRPEGEDNVERMVGTTIELVKKDTPSTIGNTLFKLRCGFYDKENEPLDKIVKTDYRKIDRIIEATQQLIKIFNCPDINDDKIKELFKTNKSIIQNRKCLDNIMFAGKSRKKINKTKRTLRRKKKYSFYKEKQFV